MQENQRPEKIKLSWLLSVLYNPRETFEEIYEQKLPLQVPVIIVIAVSFIMSVIGYFAPSDTVKLPYLEFPLRIAFDVGRLFVSAVIINEIISKKLFSKVRDIFTLLAFIYVMPLFVLGISLFALLIYSPLAFAIALVFGILGIWLLYYAIDTVYSGEFNYGVLDIFISIPFVLGISYVGIDYAYAIVFNFLKSLIVV